MESKLLGFLTRISELFDTIIDPKQTFQDENEGEETCILNPIRSNLQLILFGPCLWYYYSSRSFFRFQNGVRDCLPFTILGILEIVLYSTLLLPLLLLSLILSILVFILLVFIILLFSLLWFVIIFLTTLPVVPFALVFLVIWLFISCLDEFFEEDEISKIREFRANKMDVLGYVIVSIMFPISLPWVLFEAMSGNIEKLVGEERKITLESILCFVLFPQLFGLFRRYYSDEIFLATSRRRKNVQIKGEMDPRRSTRN